jgi:hypothetical protein
MTGPVEFDLDAIVAAEAEAAGEPHKVTWGGETFLVPRTSEWPLETFDVLSQGNIAQALAGVLGDQWEAFYTARKPTMGAAHALLDGIAEREGFQDLGNSSASLPSPNRAMRRSRPTSSASTA